MKQILISGGVEYIGLQTAVELQYAGHKVIIVEKKDLRNKIKSTKPK